MRGLLRIGTRAGLQRCIPRAPILRSLVSRGLSTTPKPEQPKEEEGSQEEEEARRAPASRANPFSWKAAGLVLVVGAVGAVVYDYRRERHQSTMKVVDTAGKLRLGGPWDLVDQDGKPCTEKDYAGQYTLIYFGFTACPDICPNELHKMKAALETVDKTEGMPTVQPLFITIDPRRDTPAKMKDYAKDFHPRTRYLTGTPEQIAKVAKLFRVYFSMPEEADKGEENYLVDHSIFFYLMDRNNEILDVYGKNYTAEEVAERMIRKLHEDRRK